MSCHSVSKFCETRVIDNKFYTVSCLFVRQDGEFVCLCYQLLSNNMKSEQIYN